MNDEARLLAAAEELAARQRQLNDPASYLMSDELRQAVEVAEMLGQPLLVTGRPGTGKTHLARRVAFERGLDPLLFPLEFHTKSTSAARDLFYQYDALLHFRDASLRDEEGKKTLDPKSYVTFEALGLAVLLSLPADDPARMKVQARIPEPLRKLGGLGPVVLIDEIDKAPRDLPNDVLNEFDRMTFTVREVTEDNVAGLTFRADPARRPVVIITSNSERDLPDAFLRRCVFYHIEPPDAAMLERIVGSRLNLKPGFTAQMRRNAVEHFIGITGLKLKKSPTTAELLSWLRVLEARGLDVNDRGRAREVEATYVALAKYADDLDKMKKALHRAPAAAAPAEATPAAQAATDDTPRT